MTLPVLYSFRRCPYAMRARVAMFRAGVDWEHREILLKDKPAAMIEASPKATVPVLVLPDGQVIDESLDIMLWALDVHDPDGWLQDRGQSLDLIARNDGPFKTALDQYKYFVRHPARSQEDYRREGELFLGDLEQRLAKGPFLLGPDLRLADIAIFTFIRQFANVDRGWFDVSPYVHTRNWLANCLGLPEFKAAMHKFNVWKPSEKGMLSTAAFDGTHSGEMT